MSKTPRIGSFEQDIMAAIMHLRGKAYGMRIGQLIHERTGEDVAVGALYLALNRLEEKGFVSSWRGNPTPERGGRAKRYFQIEAPGQEAYLNSIERAAKMAKGLPEAGGIWAW